MKRLQFLGCVLLLAAYRPDLLPMFYPWIEKLLIFFERLISDLEALYLPLYFVTQCLFLDKF